MVMKKGKVVRLERSSCLRSVISWRIVSVYQFVLLMNLKAVTLDHVSTMLDS